MIDTKDMRKEQLQRTFQLFDKKGQGKISKEEIKLVLSKIETYKNMPESFFVEVLNEVDSDRTGFVKTHCLSWLHSFSDFIDCYFHCAHFPNPSSFSSLSCPFHLVFLILGWQITFEAFQKMLSRF